MNNLTIEQCYEILNLTSTSNIEDIDHSYYQLIGEKLKTGNKEDLINLKQAHSQLIEYYQIKQENNDEIENNRYQKFLANLINKQLKSIDIRVKLELD